MKKSISVLLAILLTMATILSGCGGGNSSATSLSGTGASTDDSSEQELLPDMRVLIDALEAAFCDYAGSTPYFEEEQFGDEWFVYVYPEEGGETIEIYQIDARGKITDFTEETVTLDDFHVRDEVLAKLRDSNSTSEEETVEPSDPAEDSNLEWETNTWTVTEAKDGYVIEYEVKLSPFMFYDGENAQLASYWDEIGGSNPLPDHNDLHDSLIGTASVYPKDIYCAVGTLSARNITPGWDFTPDNPYGGAFVLKLSTSDTLPRSRIYYGNGYKNIDGTMSKFGLLVEPHMESNNWGPVSFIMVLSEDVSPKYPEGRYKAEYEEGYLYMENYGRYEQTLFNGEEVSEGVGRLPVVFAD